MSVDADRERVEAFRDVASRAIRMDARDPEALREHRIHEVDVAIVWSQRQQGRDQQGRRGIRDQITQPMTPGTLHSSTTQGGRLNNEALSIEGHCQ